jgi:hypothetical protein
LKNLGSKAHLCSFEDLEKKQLHMDALEALTTIEIEFAALRDK